MEVKMKKILIVEDCQCIAEELRKIIEEINSTFEVYWCKNYEEACKLADEERIDVFIVDIILDTNKANALSGLDFVCNIRNISIYKYSPVVFITSLADSKMYAYDQLHCYRYLEKPYEAEEAKNVIKDALEMSERYEGEEYISIRDGGTIVKQKIRNIVYMESKGRKLIIRNTEGSETLYYKSIADMKKLIWNGDFFQCNRNTLVNRKFIWKIDMGRGEIMLKDGYGVVEFGRVYKKKISEEFGNSITFE